MSKYAQIKRRREYYQMLRNWYGAERAAIEISAHTPQAVELSSVIDSVCSDIRSPEVAHFIELESHWEKIAGPAARLARPARLHEGVLYLEVPHSALIRELAPSLDLFSGGSPPASATESVRRSSWSLPAVSPVPGTQNDGFCRSLSGNLLRHFSVILPSEGFSTARRV